MSNILGPVLLGFGDFFVGATKPKTPVKPAKPVPTKGKVPVKKAASSKKGSPHKAALVNAAAAGHKAIEMGKKAAAKAATYKPAQHGPLVPLTATKVHGDGQIVLGAAAPTVLTAKQHAAVAKHTNKIARALAANKRVNIAAALAKDAGEKALKLVKVAAPFLKQKFSATPKTRVLGDVELLGALELMGDEELLGLMEILGVDASGLNPGDPGYDPTTDPSSSQYVNPNSVVPAQGTGGADPSSGIVTAPDGTVLYDPSQDPMVQPLPQRGGQLSQSDAQVVWQSVPDDGIPYDGSQGFPDRSVGSYNAFYGPSGATNGYVVHGDGKWWLEQGSGNFDQQSPQPPGYGSDQGLGPLIGNPSGPLAGLQWAATDKKWFWQSQNAPASATAEIDHKITEANNAVIAANTATAVAQAAQMAKDAADAAEAQAKQDAANALAQSAADTQSQIAQQQQEAQQGQLDIQQQQADLAAAKQQADIDAQQQAADIAAAKQQADVQAAAQNALIEQASIWNQWAKENPEAAVQQMQDEEASTDGGDDGLDEGDGGGDDSDFDNDTDSDEDIEGDDSWGG